MRLPWAVLFLLMKRAWNFDFSFSFLCEAKRHSRAAALFTEKSAQEL